MIPRALRLRRHFSLAIPHSLPDVEPTVLPHDRKIRSLVHSLHADADHGVIWRSYNDALNALGPSAIPLSLHQQVLRQCTLPKARHRDSITHQISKRLFSSPFHIHESRFQAIVQNIVATGAAPAVADYNFILDQLASVGYYTGAYTLYQHMARADVQPDAKTFGLCFRSMAVRLNLPVPHEHRADLVAHIAALFQQLMQDHQRLAIPMNPINMDSILRIMRHTRDRAAFESVLATAYGIDLNNPDRLALEYANPDDPNAPAPTAPLPFSTAALNTTLDLLGHDGDISHLVSAFEVLTQPLPQAAQHFFNSFEDDEDDISAGAVPVPPARIPAPHAVPNTTTYAILLRHVCQHGHAVLARHYLIQARRLDAQLSYTLRQTVAPRQWHPARLAAVPAPRFALSAPMLLSVLGLANRDKDFQLMRWLQGKMHAILKKQRMEIEFYEQVVARIERYRPVPTPAPSAPPPADPASAPDADASSSSSDAPPTDASSPTPPQKPFDPALHLQILRDTLTELTEVAARVEYDAARTAQRVKERLGRRVWAERDIYLADAHDRLVVPKDSWRAMVNFRPMPPGIDEGAYRRPRARGPFTPNPRPRAEGDEAGAEGGEREMSTTAAARTAPPKSILTPPIPVLWRMRTRAS
ncbi:hypothetical protein BJ912DRAFT_35467 [Pholiota molesta]|nr:hypothetical protein BJ912DRAFT_35467 [Pholiota molesta]